MENKYEINDRYSATGTPYPDENSCSWCEGMGVSPLNKNVLNQTAVVEGRNHKLLIIGQMEQDDSPTEEDDYVFVRCPACFGTRKKTWNHEEALAILRKDFDL